MGNDDGTRFGATSCGLIDGNAKVTVKRPDMKLVVQQAHQITGLRGLARPKSRITQNHPTFDNGAAGRMGGGRSVAPSRLPARLGSILPAESARSGIGWSYLGIREDCRLFPIHQFEYR